VNAPSAAKSFALNDIIRWCGVLVRPPRTRVPRPAASTLAVIGLTLIVTVGSMFFLDVAASDWARALPVWFTDIFEQITDFGLSGWFLFPFGLLLMCLAAAASRPLSLRAQNLLAMLSVRFGFLFLAIGLPGLFVAIVKRLIGRARPYVGSHDDPFAYLPFIWQPEYASMPSGHATTAASAAIAIGALLPPARGVMWVYALIIMFSRVVVLAHHPSDVIAGGLVGVVGAGLVRRWFAARRLLFSATDLRALPWPSFKRVGEAAREVFAGTGGRRKA
jgi:membrane-associated phospholipid phosphatase